ncbi:MAG: c-type cytochrome [Polyangiales bacterium]
MKWLLLLLVVVGCRAPKSAQGSSALHLESIPWNDGGNATFGTPQAIADAGDEVVVFSDRGATAFVDLRLAGSVAASIDWTDAAVIPAPDGTGSWFVGVDRSGVLHRVRARNQLEVVSDRWGLGRAQVRKVADVGGGHVAFGFAEPNDHPLFALTDGDKVLRFEHPFETVAGGGGRTAGIMHGVVRAIRAGQPKDDTWALADAAFVAVDASGRVYAATKRAVYAEDGQGQLVRKHRASDEIHGLCASGARVWFADGDALGLIESDRTAVSANVIAPDARLAGSPTGDVWVISEGKLARYGTSRAASRFQQLVARVNARVCVGCHGAGSASGLDLSTQAKWEANRASIRKRVVEQHTMPPLGSPFSEADRAMIDTWTSAAP